MYWFQERIKSKRVNPPYYIIPKVILVLVSQFHATRLHFIRYKSTPFFQLKGGNFLVFILHSISHNSITCAHSSKWYGRSHAKRRRSPTGSLVKIFNRCISWSNPAMDSLSEIFRFNIQSALLEKVKLHV